MSIRSLLFTALIRFSPRTKVHGVELAAPTGVAGPEELFRKAGQALELLSSTAPRLLRRTQRYLNRIVFVSGGGEVYHERLGAYLVDLPTFQSRSIREVASAIVHETVHARLVRWGIQYDAKRRDDIERVCVNEEIAFLARLPESGEVIATKRESLKTRWWTKQELHQRRLAQLRAHGIPQAFIRLYDWLRGAVR